MEPTTSATWISTVHIVGAVQGIFLAALLFSHRRNSVANKYLGLVMVVFTIDLLSAAYLAKGMDLAFPHFIGIDHALALL